MRKSIADKVKDLFGSGFKKRVKKAESLKALQKELEHKRSVIHKKMKSTKSASEKKLLDKKLKVLEEQLKKIVKRR